MSFQPKNIRELLNWSYANLAAYQIALKQTPPHYTKACWMTRSRIYKGLQAGEMERASIYRNEREKLTHKDECAYCGGKNVPLTLDHLFAKSKKGSDSGDNLVYCCQACNSSKGKKDYFEWVEVADMPISTSIAERYLKNAYNYCEQRGLLDTDLDKAPADLPFLLTAIPLQYSLPKL